MKKLLEELVQKSQQIFKNLTLNKILLILLAIVAFPYLLKLLYSMIATIFYLVPLALIIFIAYKYMLNETQKDNIKQKIKELKIKILSKFF